MEIVKEYKNVNKVLTMRRTTSSVIVTARKLKMYASALDDDFSYILREITDNLTFRASQTVR